MVNVYLRLAHVGLELILVFSQAESITEGTLKQWSKQVGDFVSQDEEIATIETDKVSSTAGLGCTTKTDHGHC